MDVPFPGSIGGAPFARYLQTPRQAKIVAKDGMANLANLFSSLGLPD